MRFRRSGHPYKSNRTHQKYQSNDLVGRANSGKTKKWLLLVSSSAILLSTPHAYAATQTVPTISNYTLSQSGRDIVINGSHFGSSSSQDTVKISGNFLPIKSWSRNQIVASLSAHVNPGHLVVQNAVGSSQGYVFSGMAQGYYSLTDKGQVTAHGNVAAYGDFSTKGISTRSPAVQLVPTSDYRGYWILTQSGRIYSFGNAASLGKPSSSSSISAVSLAVNSQGTGGLILGSKGQVYPVGSQSSYGSPSHTITAQQIAMTPDGNGYWILSRSGKVYNFGDAVSYGQASLSSSSSSTLPSYSEGSLLRVKSTSAVFMLLHGTLHHIPTAQMFTGLGEHWSQVHKVSSLAQFSEGKPLVVPYVSGTLLRVKGGSTIYVVKNGVMRPIRSASMFHNMGYRFSQVHTVSQIHANWPQGPALTSSGHYYPSGSVVTVSRRHTVYMVDNGVLRPIPSATTFHDMGYRWNQVQTVVSTSLPVGPALSTSARAYPTGTLLRAQGAQAVYLDQNGNLRHVQSAQSLYRLGYNFSNVMTVPSVKGYPIGTGLATTSVPQGSGTASSSQPHAVSFAPTIDGKGYWILLSNGHVQTFGNAPSFGHISASQLGGHTAVSFTPSPDQNGYDLLTSSGQVFRFGDAYSSGTATSSQQIAISPRAKGNFLSMSYGFFAPGRTSNQMLQQSSVQSQLSAINPTWFFVSGNTSTSGSGQWAVSPASSTVTSSFIQSIVDVAHAQHILVMPSIAYRFSSSSAMISTASGRSLAIQQILALVTQDHFDGITIDFENSGLGSESIARASDQYTDFVTKLGSHLHAMGKKLMVDVYPSPYPNTIYNWAAFSSSVDWINVMPYPEHGYASTAGPTEGYYWLKNYIVPYIANSGVSPHKIVLGVGSYGHGWKYSNSQSYSWLHTWGNRRMQAYIQKNNITPTWDPWAKAEFFTTGSLETAPMNALQPSNKVHHRVQNLQAVLNIVLLDYALAHHKARPPFLWTDGVYGTQTKDAVTLFQSEFNVAASTPGTYGTQTAQALQQAINKYQVGTHQYWDETSRSIEDLLHLARSQHFAGIANWRMPFVTSGYWSVMKNNATVIHY